VDENDILLDEINNNQPQDQEQSSSSDVIPPKRKRKGAVSSLFSDLYNAKKSKTVVTHDKLDLVKPELDHYKRERIADLDDDPLEWWKGNYTHYAPCEEVVVVTCHQCQI